MKAFLSSAFLSSLLLCLDPLLAQTPVPQEAATSDRANQARQPRPDHATRQLLKLLKMDAAELRDLRATLERIDSMPPEEKAMLRQRIKKMQAMDPQQIETLRRRFDAIPPERRQAMRQRWLEKSPAERRAWRARLRELPAQARHELMLQEGILPTPPHPKRPRLEQPSTEPPAVPAKRTATAE